jgi:hypothetical protein
VDQDAFRKTYRDVNERFCAYEKSILTNHCLCSQAERFCIAEREGVRCLSDEGQTRCLELLHLLREQARFALRTDQDKSILPHGKAMRIQVGGLRGLEMVLSDAAEAPARIGNIYELIGRALEQFQRLDRLPFSKIMQQVAAYRGRTRSRKK